jgi:Zn-dependent protease with chaperone function
VLGLVVALLLSPLLLGILGLLLDLVNFVVPTPDLITRITDVVFAATDAPGTVSIGRWLAMGACAALPGLVLMGLVLMGLVLRGLGGAMRAAMAGDPSLLGARVPNPGVLAEQRFANIAMEMALAASLPPPRVLVADQDAVNAVAFGTGPGDATIVVTRGLLARVDRAQLQGVAGHLVGAIANGDLAAGARVATLLSLFGLVARLASSFSDRAGLRRLLRLLRGAFARRDGRSAGELAMMLTNPLKEKHDAADAGLPAREPKPWQAMLWLPLAGPLAIGGFFGGLVCTLVLGPVLALSWRRRKYLADATAVRLTRDPDGLGGALAEMRGEAVAGPFGAWLAHMSVVPDGRIGARSILGGASVSMSPALPKRLRALGQLGARDGQVSEPPVPVLRWLILGPLFAVLGVLMAAVVGGLLYVSVAMSGLFTWLPAVVLNHLLR